uniref:Uncharacterized protein n=1 Tax=Oryza sativa subsp. japonica TaxID=39947 RepID=Q69MQ6_ORYSJ|nr:hypothetical protein [Oryza sativa Japonica Group]
MGAREVRRKGFGCAWLRSGAPVGRMAAGPRAAARLAVDRAHGRKDGGRGRLTGLARSKPRWRRRGAYVAAMRAGAKGEEEAPGIGRPTTREAFRRAAANLSERPPPAARGGQGESV